MLFKRAFMGTPLLFIIEHGKFLLFNYYLALFQEYEPPSCREFAGLQSTKIDAGCKSGSIPHLRIASRRHITVYNIGNPLP